MRVKNYIISVLCGYAITQLVAWIDLTGEIFGGIVTALFVWVILVTYDEIVRQRERSRRRRIINN